MKRYDYPKTEENKLGHVIFVPNNYDPTKQYPMILFLHGAGERGNGTTDLEKCLHIGVSSYLNKGQKELDAVVLCPQCHLNFVWNHLVLDLKELVEKVTERYNIDPTRRTVTGLSMGGFGTWEMGITFPDMFAAIAPVCGGGMAWRTDLLQQKPIWAFHGDADPVVDISNSLDMVNNVRKRSQNIRFTVFNGVGHASWDDAYLTTNVLDWLLEQHL